VEENSVESHFLLKIRYEKWAPELCSCPKPCGHPYLSGCSLPEPKGTSQTSQCCEKERR